MPAGATLTAMLRAPKGSASKPLRLSSSEISVKMACCAGSEFEHQRHEQPLAFDAFRGALLQDLFEQHAFVRHVLIDNPQALRDSPRG